MAWIRFFQLITTRHTHIHGVLGANNVTNITITASPFTAVTSVNTRKCNKSNTESKQHNQNKGRHNHEKGSIQNAVFLWVLNGSKHKTYTHTHMAPAPTLYIVFIQWSSSITLSVELQRLKLWFFILNRLAGKFFILFWIEPNRMVMNGEKVVVKWPKKCIQKCCMLHLLGGKKQQ